MLDPMTEMWAEVHNRLSQEGEPPKSMAREQDGAPDEIVADEISAGEASSPGGFESPTYPHVVVVNDEGMYSISPATLPLPSGWEVRAHGTRAECLDLIDELWTDMRPRSLREAMRPTVDEESTR
jgi:MbtH protein